MTLEELADLIRANSATTNGRIDGLRIEFNAALMNIQNDLTDLRGDVKAGRDDLSGVGSDVAALKSDMAGVSRASISPAPSSRCATSSRPSPPRWRNSNVVPFD